MKTAKLTGMQIIIIIIIIIIITIIIIKAFILHLLSSLLKGTLHNIHKTNKVT